MRYKKKKVNDMSTLIMNKVSLTDFIKQNKSQIYETARNNTNLNSDGKPTISKNDEWFGEDIWDEHFKRVAKDK